MDEKTFNRFMSKVSEDKDTGCLLWVAATNPKGYGIFSIAGKLYMAHRLSWEHYKGPIPPGLFVLHNCPTVDTPSCINPYHLYLGTHQDNMLDKINKGQCSHASASHLGESNPKAIIKSQDVPIIRELYSSGQFTQTEIAIFYTVAQRTISDIVTRKTWSHVK
jgi:hypothetical protein